MYIYAECICISLRAMLPLKFSEIFSIFFKIFVNFFQNFYYLFQNFIQVLPAKTIGLFTVFAAILFSRQSGSKYESLYGNSAPNIFNNILVLKSL